LQLIKKQICDFVRKFDMRRLIVFKTSDARRLSKPENAAVAPTVRRG